MGKPLNKVYIFIIFIILATGLVYIYTNLQSGLNQNVNRNNLDNKNLNANRVPPAELNEEELKIFSTILNKDRELNKSIFELVRKNAKKETSLEINNCKPKPFILEVSKSPLITIKNSDTVTHSVFFDVDNIATVSAGKSLEYQINTVNSAGMFPYSCDQNDPAGILISL